MKSFSILLTTIFLTFSFSSGVQAAPGGDEGWPLGANFYEIDPGQYYRSAQLSSAQLENYIKQYKIQTVINLRGENRGEAWYQAEEETTNRLNVGLINIGMSANRLPHREDLIKLLEAFKDAPRPLLVHCQAGADRTGEASALYQMIYMGKPKVEAMKMLNIRYGHIASAKPAKDYFIQSVWAGVDWAYQSYQPCAGQYQYYDKNDSACRRD
jgi:protein tyrosine/serine phosphatase